nr:EOG090X0ARF [Eulimnadia texana]
MPKKGSNKKVAPTVATPSKGTSASAAAQAKASAKGKLEYSDDDSQFDSASVVSSMSENQSICEEGGEVDERSQMEILEEKLKDAIDLTSQKSSHGRTTSFEALCKAFTMKYLPDFVAGRRMTLMDCVERGLKKGRGAEQESSAKLGFLLCLQLGPTNDSEAIFREQKPVITTIMEDPTASPSVRAQCCTTLGLCSFLLGHDLVEVQQTMTAFENIFSASYPRGPEATLPSHSPEVLRLHSAALSSWSLLMTLLSARQIHAMANSYVRRLSGLLDSPDVDLRIGAGEAIALIYEGAREFDEDFGFAPPEDEEGEAAEEVDEAHLEDVAELCAKLRQLATDSHKYRAKKDRKQQRSSFRDFLRAVEENEPPDVRVKFGSEVLELDSWTRKKQYDAFCQLLGSGMNLHLTQNEMVREIFGLGQPLIIDSTTRSKATKLERHHLNMMNFKARSIVRGKNRDKRAVVL